MRIQAALGLAVVLLAAACAPIESVRVTDDVVRSKTVTAPGHDPVVAVTVSTDEGGGAIGVRSHETCEQHVEDLHHRTRLTERHSQTAALAALYGLGGLSTGIGTWIVLDAPNIPESGDPRTVNPFGRSEAYKIGAGFLAVGVPLLGAGIATSLRARDGVKNLGSKWETRDDSAKSIDCHDTVVSGAEVVLSTASARTSLGKTTWKGRLTFTWETLGEVLDTDEPPDVATLEVSGYGSAGRIDLSAGKAFFAKREVDEINRLAAADKVDEALIHVRRAKALGADVTELQGAIERAPTSVARKQETEQRRRAQWGANFAEWASRNRTLAKSLVSLSADLHAAREAQQAYEQEKAKNDEKNVEESIIPVPVFPEITGSFMFVKILDRSAGEALFQASDGPFVLHLSPGDSFQASPGESVQMTAHNRGGSVLMTNGQRVPLFWSGNSPAHIHKTLGFHPNRTRERRLQQKATDLKAAVDAARARLFDGAGSTSTNRFALKEAPRGSRVFVTVRADGEGVTEVEIEDASGSPVYCVGSNACGEKGQPVPLSELRNAQ